MWLRMLDIRHSSVKTIRRGALAVLLTLAASSGGGCSVQMDDDETVSTARQATVELDSVSSLVVWRTPSIVGVRASRALDSQNALPSGVLANGPLRAQLVALATLPLRSAGASTKLSALAALPNGPSLIRYVARCALAESDPPLQVRVGGALVAYPGRLGLAREWGYPERSLDGTGQRWVTACLMAHANNLGPVDIAISGLHDRLTSPTTAPSSGEIWPFEEAAFYGNLFSSNGPAMFACSGAGAQERCDDSGIGRDLERRICGRQPERCGFTFTGPCYEIPPRVAPTSDACSDSMPYASCGSAGASRYGQVITASLRTIDGLSLHPWCTGSSTCNHSVCAMGAPLNAACARGVCSGDAYCCTRAWDSACVAQARAAGFCGP
jgi:hypothetical protein